MLIAAMDDKVSKDQATTQKAKFNTTTMPAMVLKSLLYLSSKDPPTL